MSIRDRLTHFFLLTITLFIFWVVLVGRLETTILLIGLVSSVIVAVITRPLLNLPWGPGATELRPAWNMPWLRLAAYAPWLMWQLLQANVQVAWIVLQPALPIHPQVVRFRKKLPGPVAHVVLANSITLTPGTVTIDLEDDLYLVHALSREAARSLVPEKGEGEMQRRVEAVFAGRKPASFTETGIDSQ